MPATQACQSSLGVPAGPLLVGPLSVGDQVAVDGVAEAALVALAGLPSWSCPRPVCVRRRRGRGCGRSTEPASDVPVSRCRRLTPVISWQRSCCWGRGGRFDKYHDAVPNLSYTERGPSTSRSFGNRWSAVRLRAASCRYRAATASECAGYRASLVPADGRRLQAGPQPSSRRGTDALPARAIRTRFSDTWGDAVSGRRRRHVSHDTHRSAQVAGVRGSRPGRCRLVQSRKAVSIGTSRSARRGACM